MMTGVEVKWGDLTSRGSFTVRPRECIRESANDIEALVDLWRYIVPRR